MTGVRVRNRAACVPRAVRCSRYGKTADHFTPPVARDANHGKLGGLWVFGQDVFDCGGEPVFVVASDGDDRVVVDSANRHPGVGQGLADGIAGIFPSRLQ